MLLKVLTFRQIRRKVMAKTTSMRLCMRQAEKKQRGMHPMWHLPLKENWGVGAYIGTYLHFIMYP